MDKRGARDDQSERRREGRPQSQHQGKPSSHAGPGPSEPSGARQLLAKTRDGPNQSGGPGDATSSARTETLIAASPAQGPPGSAGQASLAAPGQSIPGDGGKSSGIVKDECNAAAEENAFVDRLRAFHRSRGTEFKAPKFYGTPVNLLKLWRLVCQHGGYDQVTAGKQWRVVGDHFNPPKSCTTLSWSFRGFYEKSLLDFERVHGVEDTSHTVSPPQGQKPKSDDKGRAAPEGKAHQQSQGDKGASSQNEGLERKGTGETGRPPTDIDSGRLPLASKRRHPSQRTPADGPVAKAEEAEVDPAADRDQEGPALKKPKKNATDASTRMAQAQSDRKPGPHKSASPGGGGGKQVATPPSGEKPDTPASLKGKQLKGRKVDSTSASVDSQPAVVWDVGEECSWVKVNVRRSSDCFEIYALVPGLLREEITVQAEDAGRVVIAGVPEREDNPWGVRRFKKIVILPGPVLAAETKAVVALHGQLYVHLPLAPPAEGKLGDQKVSY